MKKKHRKYLCELMNYCNMLGGELDGTATCGQKYIDRQRALMDVYRVLYAVLSDHPENDDTDFSYDRADNALKKLKLLKEKVYPDKNGNY